MIIGTLLISPKSGDRKHLTPWFTRGSDNAIFTYEVIYNDMTSGGITVTAYTKDKEDPGSAPGSAVNSFTQMGSTDFWMNNATSGLKELVRFEVSISADDPGAAVMMRFLSPTWYSTAKV